MRQLRELAPNGISTEITSNFRRIDHGMISVPRCLT
jgi:hypothetical protein